MNNPPAPPRILPVSRPLAATTSLVMTIVASVEWLLALLLGWMLIATSLPSLAKSAEFGDSVVYNRLARIDFALREGAIIPMVVLPLLALIFAPLIAMRSEFMRVLYCLLGVVTVGWALWHFRSSLWVGVVVALHVGIACGLMWLPSVTQWYRDAAQKQGK